MCGPQSLGLGIRAGDLERCKFGILASPQSRVGHDRVLQKGQDVTSSMCTVSVVDGA
jgi:hypothetical protein